MIFGLTGGHAGLVGVAVLLGETDAKTDGDGRDGYSSGSDFEGSFRHHC